MRNRKGFTLVELLAIIVIIAIITLITVPIVKNMIKASRKKAFEASLQSLISSAKTYYSSNAGDEFNTTVFTIKDHKIKPGDLETKGKLPLLGKVEIKGVNGEDATIPDGDIWLQAVDDTQTFCGYKNHKDELKITEDLSKCDKLDLEDIDDPDLSDPELNIVTDENVTGNSIGVYARCTHESGIKEVKFKRGNGQWYTSNRYSGNQYFYKFTNLEHNKWYEFTVKCIANNGQSVEDKTNSILAIAELPDYSASNSWARQREVIVSYPKPGVSGVEYTYQYKIGEDDTFKTIGTRTCAGQECGDESSSTNKYKIETYTGETCASDKVCYKFTFYDEVFNGKPLITNVKVNDEDSTNSFTIEKIDRTAPTWNKIENSSNQNWTNQNITVTLKATDNSGSGIKNYKYSYSSNPSGDSTSSADSNSKWIIYTNSNKETFQTTPYTAERNQYSYFQVCDNVGNCSETNKTMIRIDKTAPTLTVNNPTSGHWNYSQQEITLIASGETNNTSGYNGFKYGWANTTVTAVVPESYNQRIATHVYTNETNHDIYYKACDKAGNCSGVKSTKLMIDRTPPTIKEVAVYKWNSNIEPNPTSPTGTKIGNNTWIGSGYNALIYATAEDKPSTSGTPTKEASGVKIYYGDIWGEQGQNNKSSYGVSVQRRYYNIKTSGEYHATFMACDNAGNCSDMSNVVKINIDKVKPNVTLEKHRDKKDGCYVHLSVSGTDSLSGIKKARYVNSKGNERNIKDGWNGCGIPSNGGVICGTPSVTTHDIDAQYLISDKNLNFKMNIFIEDEAGNKKEFNPTINTTTCPQPEQKYYCKYKDGKYYDKSGNVVNKTQYEDSCNDDSSSGGGGGGGTQCVPKTATFLQARFTEGSGYTLALSSSGNFMVGISSGNTTVQVTANNNVTGIYYADANIPDSVLYNGKYWWSNGQWTKVTISKHGYNYWNDLLTLSSTAHYYFYIIDNCGYIYENDRREITTFNN